MATLKDIAFRIDKDPVLFLGCSGTEIGALVLLGGISGIILGIIVAFVTGTWFLILPSIFICAFLAVLKGGRSMMYKKEGKPEGYYGRLILSWLSDKGLNKLFIKRSGYWGIRK